MSSLSTAKGTATLLTRGHPAFKAVVRVGWLLQTYIPAEVPVLDPRCAPSSETVLGPVPFTLRRIIGGEEQGRGTRALQYCLIVIGVRAFPLLRRLLDSERNSGSPSCRNDRLLFVI
jgi:hypothetical protein